MCQNKDRDHFGRPSYTTSSRIGTSAVDFSEFGTWWRFWRLMDAGQSLLRHFHVLSSVHMGVKRMDPYALYHFSHVAHLHQVVMFGFSCTLCWRHAVASVLAENSADCQLLQVADIAPNPNTQRNAFIFTKLATPRNRPARSNTKRPSHGEQGCC